MTATAGPSPDDPRGRRRHAASGRFASRRDRSTESGRSATATEWTVTRPQVQIVSPGRPFDSGDKFQVDFTQLDETTCAALRTYVDAHVDAERTPTGTARSSAAGTPLKSCRRGTKLRLHGMSTLAPRRRRDLVAVEYPRRRRGKAATSLRHIHVVAAASPRPPRHIRVVVVASPRPPRHIHVVAMAPPRPPRNVHVVAAAPPRPPRHIHVVAAAPPRPTRARRYPLSPELRRQSTTGQLAEVLDAIPGPRAPPEEEEDEAAALADALRAAVDKPAADALADREGFSEDEETQHLADEEGFAPSPEDADEDAALQDALAAALQEAVEASAKISQRRRRKSGASAAASP